MKKTLLRCFALLTSLVGCAALFGAGYWCGSRDVGWRGRDGTRAGEPHRLSARCAGKGRGARAAEYGPCFCALRECFCPEPPDGLAAAGPGARAEHLARVRAARKFLRDILCESADAPRSGQTPPADADTGRRLEDARKLLDFQNAPAEFYGAH